MVKRIAMLFGIVFIVVGILGLIAPGGMQMGDMNTPAKLLGLFPINLLHNVVHLAFGLWGVAAARSFNAAATYAKAGGVIYLLLAALGVAAPTTFGLIPIGGNDVWLHCALGLVLAAVGFTAKEMAPAPATA